MREARARSLTKAITWRIIGTLSLMAVSFFYTDSYIFSVNIGIIDLISNIVLYFIHERIWNMTDWGQFGSDNLFVDTRKRSIAKTLTWRLAATAYLVLISYIVSDQIFISLGIAVTDAVLNLIEYYIHERIWDGVEWGKNEYIFEEFFKDLLNK